MTLTEAQLSAATGCAAFRAKSWLPHITETMRLFAIDSPLRAAAFLAQIGHESGRLKYSREIWGPTPAQARYEGRADLGNTTPGDGARYMGRGLIQTTGRANYRAATEGLQAMMADVPDFEATPVSLELPRWAALSAGLYWASRSLNVLADAQDFEKITRRINGGLNGYPDRLALYTAAKQAFGV